MKSNLQLFCSFNRLQKGTMFCEWRHDNTGNKSSCTISRAFGFFANHILHMTVDGFHVSCFCLSLFPVTIRTIVTLWTPSFCAWLTDLLKLDFLQDPTGKEAHLFRSVCTGVLSPPPSLALCALGWPNTERTWLYCDYFSFGVSCTVVVLTCFVTCGFVYVGVS
jgi:hypothetical protein